MYFGNTDGILEFDGRSWRLIKIPNNSVVRSLCIDNEGKIYVAASSEFGYLSPDSTGLLQFVSLLEYMEDKYKEFGDVWDVAAASHGVYFKTRDKIFRWRETKIKVFEPVNAFRLYKINDDIYTRDAGTGLWKIGENSLELIPDGKAFAETGVFDMLSFGDRILVTTSRDGLYLYDGKSFSKFETEADKYFFENRIYNASMLNDGRIAFATMRGGVVIVNADGSLSKIINSNNGLYSDIVYDVFADNQGGLWLAMADGISRIESSPVFSFMPVKKTGNKSITDLFRFGNKIYAANAFGLFFLDESASVFKSIPGFTEGGGNYISIGNELFAASNTVIYRIDNNNKAVRLFNFEIPALNQSAIDSSIVYVNYRIGLAFLKYENGNLKLVKDTTPIGDEILSLTEDTDGSLWIETYYGGVVHIKSDSGKLFSVTEENKIEINRYTKDEGLPGNQYNIFSVDNKILFATDAGLYSFDKKSETFVPESMFGPSFNDSTHIIEELEKDRSGNLWMLVKTKKGKELGKAVKQNDGKYLWKAHTAFRILDLSNINLLYPDFDPETKKELLWISTGKELTIYDPEINENYDREFSTHIRNVIINQDSSIYNGTFYKHKDKMTLSFDKNNVLFKFSAASYIKPESNLYQYYLEGNDEGWSQWSLEPVKAYTNLSGGDYVFHVRSRNIYRIIGKEDSFAFTVLSPWYFSWWAYFIYGFIFLGLLFQIRHYEIKRINRKHIRELEHKEYEKLKDLDQMKSQFFANISHEFRTPLTLILGQIDSVMSSKVDIKEKGKLQVANRNARRLLTLINQLLDLSKLEAGSMKLNAEQHNIVSFLKSLFYSFESLAEAQKITLKFESEYKDIPVLFDPDKMEKVFYNIISNALKFTKSGEVKVVIKNIDNVKTQITIKDTGIGISEEKLEHIFNRFYQADTSDTRDHEGTGIGLALTKELIELHKGDITVVSKRGEGTEFIITLPSGDAKMRAVELPDFDFENKNNGVEKFSTEQEYRIQNQISKNEKEIILIVEDNSDVRTYITEQLEIDFTIIETSNGEEGIQKAQSIIPDLIITDVMMPKMDGYKFSSEIRCNEKTSHIPIIMLTAKAGLDDKIEGLETGIDAYITKPFSAKELKVRVRNLIQQRKQLRKKFSRSTVIKPSEVSAISADQKFIEKTIKIIEDNIEDFKFSIDNLAEELHMSSSQLSRKLNALIDQPAGQLIRSLRLQRASDLLKQNFGNVAEVCYKTGFNDQAYFSRAFKKQFGVSPSDFKESERKKIGESEK
jgi:signal transduction histidine kinase/DNA-binding response OmpR family regulator